MMKLLLKHPSADALLFHYRMGHSGKKNLQNLVKFAKLPVHGKFCGECKNRLEEKQ